MVFYKTVSNSKFPQVSRTLLNILANLNNAVVWMVSTHPFISKSSSPFTNPLVTVPSASVLIGITVTFMFHSFFSYFPKALENIFKKKTIRYVPNLFFRFPLVLPWGQPERQSPLIGRFTLFLFFFFFFLLTITWSSRLVQIRWSVCISKDKRILYASFSKVDSKLFICYHLFVWSNLNFLHIFHWITLPTQSCLVLYSFCANLQHSIIRWLIVSSLSPHNLHLLFCCVVSLLALT